MLILKKQLLCSCLKSFLQSLSLSLRTCEEMQEGKTGACDLNFRRDGYWTIGNCKAILQMKHFSFNLLMLRSPSKRCDA